MKPKLVLSDFDGTLTLGTELTPDFFQILSFLNNHDIPLVIVTGRSQAWGHFLLTHFPLLQIVTEGGGVISRQSEYGGHDIVDEFLISENQRETLCEVTTGLLSQFPELRLSIDSQGRKTDRAIELSLLKELALKNDVEKFLKDYNVNFSCSNVHLNFWVGDIKKSIATEYLMKKDFPSFSLSDCLFFGDSLNDESLFEILPYSVGVSNIAHILDQFEFKPHIVLNGVENAGPHGVLNHLKSILEK